MPHGIRLLVSGDHALFTRPEMKVERVSYDVMTPSAARGILEAIHWKVAPHRGAWIETTFTCGKRRNERVAPRRGAWGETLDIR